MTTKPMIYTAGPITGDPFGCVRQSMDAWDRLRAMGAIPYCPQWTVIAEMVEHHRYEQWMAYDFDVIGRCDALVRLPGISPGADREVAHAEGLGLPVFRIFTAPGRNGQGAWSDVYDWVLSFETAAVA